MPTPAIVLQPIDRASSAATAKAVAPVRKGAVEAKAEFTVMLASAEPGSPGADSGAARQTATATALGIATGEQRTVRPLVAHEARKAPALEKFEGFVLRSFVEGMLPKGDSSYFGKGTAGEVWRSMLAEEIGNEMAKNGGIGIAASISGQKNSRFGDLAAPSAARGAIDRASASVHGTARPDAATRGLDALLREGDLARAAAVKGTAR